VTRSGRPTLFLLAGPNGAGKTTFYETVWRPRIAAPFINADLIQRDELGRPEPGAAYRAAELAQARREDCIARGESFVTETVFSHPSKLELLRRARHAGFRLIVVHVQLANADLAVARVRARVEEGGHDVPDNKIRACFERSLPLIRTAVLTADRAQVFDGSILNKPHCWLLDLADGRPMRIAPPPRPAWFEALYGDLAGPLSR